MSRLSTLIDALLWSPVDTVDYERECYVEVLERNRLTGNYRTINGNYRND